MIARYEVVGAIDRSAAEQIEGAVSVIGDGTSSTSSIGDQCREILTNNWPGPVVVLVKTDPPSTADPRARLREAGTEIFGSWPNSWTPRARWACPNLYALSRRAVGDASRAC